MLAFDDLRILYTYGAYAATVGTVASHQARIDEGPVWIAELDGRPVGTISAVMDGSICYVRGMGVSPHARGRGVGDALVKECVAFAQQYHAFRVRLHTTEFLHAALRLYERHGFGTVINDDMPDLFGTSLIAMERRLDQ